MEDEPATLTCSFRAMEPPITQVRWLKDGESLQSKDGVRYRIIEAPAGNLSLVFKNVQLIDRGNYVCEIDTKGFPPVRSEPAMLSVEEKLKFSPEPVNRRLELNSSPKVS